jgi:hypothetical protein
MFAAVSLAFAAIVVSDESAIDRCRLAWQSFDAEGAIASCAQAGAATDAAKADRVEAYRDLALAFLLQKRTDLAEDAFRSMLKLDEHATLGDDAGPTAQEALARVAASMAKPAAQPPPLGPAYAPAPASAPPAPPAPATPAPTPAPAPSTPPPPAKLPGSVVPSAACIAVASAGAVTAIGAYLSTLFYYQPAIASWKQRAEDPFVFLDKNADPTSSGWGAASYAGLGANDFPSEPARTTMVAVALKNERTAEDGLNLANTVAAVAVGVTVAGVVGAVALWPE